MADNTIQLAVGDGQFNLNVPQLKSLDNLVGVEANLVNEGEINLLDRPVIAIKPISYQNDNLTCEYHIHYQNNDIETPSVKLKISVFYRDMITDTSDFPTFYTNEFVPLKNEVTTIKNDEGALGNQVQAIQQTLNGKADTSWVQEKYVARNEAFSKLCETGETNCLWASDLNEQLLSIGNTLGDYLTRINKLESDTESVENGDILYEETREIVIDKNNITQTLMGSFYYYTYNYDISQWDNSVYNLTSISLKNIFIEDVNGTRQANVNEVIQKALNSITFDDNKLYGVILTPNIFNYSTGKVKAVLSCQYKKMVTKEKTE